MSTKFYKIIYIRSDNQICEYNYLYKSYEECLQQYRREKMLFTDDKPIGIGFIEVNLI